MKLAITIEVDGTEEHQEKVLEEFETARDEHEFVAIRTAGTTGMFGASVLAVTQVPVGPRGT